MESYLCIQLLNQEKYTRSGQLVQEYMLHYGIKAIYGDKYYTKNEKEFNKIKDEVRNGNDGLDHNGAILCFGIFKN